MLPSAIIFILTISVSFAVHVSAADAFEECEEHFIKVGCFKDHTRPLPKLLLNDRELIDWTHNWENFIRRLACRCAKLTRANGFTIFGLQFYGECWSGVKSNVTYEQDGHSSPKGCVGQDPAPEKSCEDNYPVCAGRERRNYIYKLMEPTLATSGTTTSNQGTATACEDHNPGCPDYVQYCSEYANIRVQCPQSCQMC